MCYGLRLVHQRMSFNSTTPRFYMYKLLDNDITTDIQKRILEYTERMNHEKIINEETERYLIQTDPNQGRFYILPKVHKQGNPERPIVSCNSHPTERISQFVDHHLNPLVQTTQSSIKDTTHFLNKLEQLGQLPPNALLVTLDVSSLHTNIPHNEGITCRHFLNTRDRNSSTVGTETLCDLIRMILTMNNGTFNDKHYLHIHGTRWEPEWHLLMPICSVPNLRQTLCHVLHTASSWYGRHLHDTDTFCWWSSCFHLLT